jgi:hypothetical protein
MIAGPPPPLPQIPMALARHQLFVLALSKFRFAALESGNGEGNPSQSCERHPQAASTPILAHGKETAHDPPL